MSLFRTNAIFLVFASILFFATAGCGGGGAADGSGGTASTTASLSWDAPDANIDGSPVSDVAGYRVYYGTSSGNYTSSVDIGLANAAVIESLTPGTTYYFVVTVYDTSGNESAYSSEVSKTI